MKLSVVVPSYNPDPKRLAATLRGLQNQTLPVDQWEIILIDNASTNFPDASFFETCSPPGLRIVRESKSGLTHARKRGFIEARADVVVLVDDDNLLAPTYLATVVEIFARCPKVGVIGGKSLPRFEATPADWTKEFFPLLALRDLGDAEKISAGLKAEDTAFNRYPDFAPIGAGMALRRAAWESWMERQGQRGGPLDRQGDKLTSGGDNDIVLSVMQAGWEVGYFPSLSLSHLIPQSRVSATYLERLNRGIQESWMRVLTLHDANPWSPLSAPSATLRKMKAWVTYRAWTSTPSRIRWQGACGHFDGRVPKSDRPHDHD